MRLHCAKGSSQISSTSRIILAPRTGFVAYRFFMLQQDGRAAPVGRDSSPDYRGKLEHRFKTLGGNMGNTERKICAGSNL
jgi:hypothetical protein